MKFDFNKVPEPVKEPEPVKLEKTQEEFDAEIEAEANKLKLNLVEVKELVDSYGGPEAFKKYFEGNVNENTAGGNNRKLEGGINDAKRVAKIGSILSGISLGIAAFFEAVYTNNNFDSDFSFGTQIDVLKEMVSEPIKNGQPEGMFLILFSGLGITAAVTAVTGGVKFLKRNRELNKQKEKDSLIFKMTDTNR